MSSPPGNIFTSLLQPPPIPPAAGQQHPSSVSAPQPEHTNGQSLPTHPSQPESQTSMDPASTIAPAPTTPQEPSKQLDVTDALTYLDLVKVQFENLPAIYNKFLDVMKDFKSSAIDTPGVIERVSTLFQGHPNLIQGFNTFLPPGYRIECAKDPMVIIVTTPSGTTTRTPTYQINGKSVSNYSHETEKLRYPSNNNIPPFTDLRPPMNEPRPVLSSTPSSHNQMHSGADVPIPSPNVGVPEHPRGPSPSVSGAHSPGIVTSASNAATVLGGMNGRPDSMNPSSGTGQVNEFHHAMTYINRIKTRFVDNQEVYKGFLQLLQAYQKEQMNIQEAYRQVAILFKDAEELLAEFKLFLPDTSSQQGVSLDTSNQAGNMIINSTWQAYGLPSDQDPSNKRRNDASTAQKRKRRVADKDGTAARGVGGRRRRQNAVQGATKVDINSPPNTGFSKHGGSPIEPAAQLQPSISQQTSDESIAAFFEHLKRSMEDEETYEEFLKVLEMFSMDILDADSLLERLAPFLSPDEMDRFLELLGWDDDKGFDESGVENDSFERRRALASLKHASNTELVTRVGPSYRSCPVVETGLACSRRDELCRSVLNDKWESHPTWASEESGFISHKKNAFEEALYRSEEERYEYQFHIEAMGRTLSLLEPLLHKLEEMPVENVTSFKLPRNLGSPTPSIHQRMIKKVYGREAGLEIIQALHEAPAYALPVVVLRLRQKDQEWRRGQTEFNKMWRDVDTRNFYKSLDHQGISFKANDKKSITIKALVGQLESCRVTAFEQGEDLTSGVSHLEFTFQDIEVVQDAMKLCFCALDRQPLVYNRFERRSIERLLRSLVPIILKKDFMPFDAAFSSPFPSSSEDDIDSDGGATVDPTCGDARDGLAATEQLMRVDETWIELASEWNSRDLGRGMEPSHQTLYTNTSIYVVIRLFQLLYARLLIVKQVSKALMEDKSYPWVPNSVAVELGMNDVSWGSTAAVAADVVGEGTDVYHFYRFLLGCIEKLFDGELDQAAFEDCTRVTFGTEAYQLFTIDKVIVALNKQVQIIVSDGRDAFFLLQEQSANEKSSAQNRIRYRIRAQVIANADENVYEVTTRGEKGEMSIRLLRKGEPPFGMTDHDLYVESYLLDYPTDGIARPSRLPYLRRCRKICAGNLGGVNWARQLTSKKHGLLIEIDENCKIRYKSDSEDVMSYIRERHRLRLGLEQTKRRRIGLVGKSYI